MQTFLWLLIMILPEPSQPTFPPVKKKRKKELIVYGRFLSTKSVTAKHAMIRIAMAATAGIKYCSTVDGAVVAGGACVGVAGSTAKLVSEYDGQ